MGSVTKWDVGIVLRVFCTGGTRGRGRRQTLTSACHEGPQLSISALVDVRKKKFIAGAKPTLSKLSAPIVTIGDHPFAYDDFLGLEY